jgi:hypothetical protein
MKLSLLYFLILTASIASAQSFEGTLVYKTDYDIHPSEKMMKMGITKELLTKKLKADDSYTDSIKTIYKAGNYITFSNFNRPTYIIYRADDNKLYSFSDGEKSDICMVTDASIDLESKMTGTGPIISKLDSIVNVNGLSCNIVRVKWKSGTYDYYYNTNTLVIDPKFFAKHIYDGWAEYLKISGALPVRIVKEVGVATVTFTLNRKKSETIDAKLFSIPKLVEDQELNQIRIANREMMRIVK